MKKLLIIGSCIFALASCNQKQNKDVEVEKPSIVGKWMKIYSGEYVSAVTFESFNKDGSYISRMEIQETEAGGYKSRTLTTEGKWNYVSDDKINIHAEEMFSGNRSLGKSPVDFEIIITRLDSDSMEYMLGGTIYKYCRK